ncbi:endolytic transglycosylase MltG [Phenylobacterium sp.]|uniref:endolytic transglycosylase MltG n=1 Tax=Phenylobacterium sp. TaxID=1871053 RepID=UPI00272F445A|nr:endolytic transglycosylase MltG [Phenylobacterium sp.]MDP1874640.1 endolytic transglycosylase MltG [Phenylobacterium sp.]MDP3491363.1 endolytic transglycosylase MltG [Phenylobacterium sp.]
MARTPRARPAKTGAGVSPLRRLLVTLVSAVVTFTLVLALAGLWALWMYQGPGPSAEGDSTTVMLRRGAGLPEIASSLESAGVISSAPIFLAAAQATGAARSLKAGEYEFPSRRPMSGVLDDIRAGRVVRHFVTIPEGVTSEMVVEILAANPLLSGVAPSPPEGALLPETYQIERGEDRAAVLQRMMDAHDEVLALLWSKRQPGLPVNSPQEAVILASVVEKETALGSERPQVASVFVNRLRRGMRLESDPTIIYGLTKGRPLGRGIRLSELNRQTPYNTYMIDGLPPTPICNPGRAALAAVLDPPESDYLFFVADGSGGHAFAATYDEHRRNVERWRRIERARAQPAETAPDAPVDAPLTAEP